jgi:hypothetical protein
VLAQLQTSSPSAPFTAALAKAPAFQLQLTQERSINNLVLAIASALLTTRWRELFLQTNVELPRRMRGTPSFFLVEEVLFFIPVEIGQDYLAMIIRKAARER